MKIRTLKQILLYNYRYVFAYSCMVVFILFFLCWRLWSHPSGVSDVELEYAATNADFMGVLSNPSFILHSILQWISMQIMGATALSFRIPSVIIAAITVILTYLLLKKWFGKPMSLLTTTLIVSADWYLFISRLGTGSIEFTLWLTAALLAITRLMAKKPFALQTLSISLVLLSFTSFGIYAAITIVACLFFMKPFRLKIQEATKNQKIAAGSILLIGLIVFIYSSFSSSGFIQSMLGISGSLPSPVQYVKNVANNATSPILVTPNNDPLFGLTAVVYFRIFEAIFMLFGLIMLWKSRVNKLNIMVLILTLVLCLLSGLSSEPIGASLILLPAMIYLAAGLKHLIFRWKKTFPKNPYARIAGYGPLGVLVILVVISHYLSYFQIWSSQTEMRLTFSKEYTLLTKELSREGRCVIIGAKEEIRELISKTPTTCDTSFSDIWPELDDQNTRVIVASADIKDGINTVTISRPLADGLANNGLHFWVHSLDKQATPDIIEVSD